MVSMADTRISKSTKDAGGSTWRGVGVIGGKFHDCFEVAPIIQGILVQHDQRNIPLKDVILVYLRPAWLVGCGQRGV